MTKKPETTRDPMALMIEKAFREARQMSLSISDAADLVAGVIRTKLEDDGNEAANFNREMISVQSIFGAKSGQPLIDFKYGLEHFTLDVGQAREHALAVLQCAEAASQDAGMFRWLTLSTLGLDPRAAAAAIGDLRRFRGDLPKDDWRTDDQKASDQKK